MGTIRKELLVITINEKDNNNVRKLMIKQEIGILYSLLPYKTLFLANMLNQRGTTKFYNPFHKAGVGYPVQISVVDTEPDH